MHEMPEDEFDFAELYIHARLQLGADPERVMVGMLFAASRLASYLGRCDLHDQALANLKADEANAAARTKASIVSGSGTPQ